MAAFSNTAFSIAAFSESAFSIEGAVAGVPAFGHGTVLDDMPEAQPKRKAKRANTDDDVLAILAVVMPVIAAAENRRGMP